MAMLDSLVKIVAAIGVVWFTIQQMALSDPTARIAIPLAAGLFTLWMMDWVLGRVSED